MFYCSLLKHTLYRSHLSTLRDKLAFLSNQSCSKLFHNNENCTEQIISIFQDDLIAISPFDFLHIRSLGNTEYIHAEKKENSNNLNIHYLQTFQKSFACCGKRKIEEL